jgi:hypothetical protein
VHVIGVRSQRIRVRDLTRTVSFFAQILSGLDAFAVQRLRKTWSDLPKSAIKVGARCARCA